MGDLLVLCLLVDWPLIHLWEASSNTTWNGEAPLIMGNPVGRRDVATHHNATRRARKGVGSLFEIA